MGPEQATEIMRQALMAAFWLSFPLLLAGFLTSILMSLVQIVTSIQDPAFASIPRLACFFVALLLCMPWMLGRIMAYTGGLLGGLVHYAR